MLLLFFYKKRKQACWFCVLSEQRALSSSVSLEMENPTMARQSGWDSIILPKKNFCNIRLVLEMKKNKWTVYLYASSLVKHLTCNMFPFPQKYLCVLRESGDDKGQGRKWGRGRGDRQKKKMNNSTDRKGA